MVVSNCSGKERSECGKIKSMAVNNCKGTKETFEKFKSGAVGEPFNDPGQYIMRKSPVAVKKVWVQSGSNKEAWKPGYQYVELGPPPKRDPPESSPRMKTHVKSEPFTNKNSVGYAVDPYEIKEDSGRLEYIKKINRLH